MCIGGAPQHLCTPKPRHAFIYSSLTPFRCFKPHPACLFVFIFILFALNCIFLCESGSDKGKVDVLKGKRHSDTERERDRGMEGERGNRKSIPIPPKALHPSLQLFFGGFL